LSERDESFEAFGNDVGVGEAGFVREDFPRGVEEDFVGGNS
jgi:hypothetical protein